MSLTNFFASLLIPVNLCIALLALAILALLFRLRRTALLLFLGGLTWVLLWSLPISSLCLGGRLEALYPPFEPGNAPKAGAMVVLGGNTAGGRANWFEPYDKTTASTRAAVAARLYLAGEAPHIIVSGAAYDGISSEAETMAATLRAEGVPERAIVLEKNSHTTYENAKFSARILNELGINEIILVTSALHMPRSVATFARQGLDVTPAAAPRQIISPKKSEFSVWLPNQRALDASRSIIKEYMGLLVYWLRGWV